MLNEDYQNRLIETDCLVLDLPDAEISYFEKFLDTSSAWQLFEYLKSSVDWRQETISIYGKEHPIPRLWCWMADADLKYSYSNLTMAPVQWSAQVMRVKSQLELTTNQHFNSVLINYYRDGQDSNGWHADNEPELGSNPVIASLSLGATRDFHLRHNRHKQHKCSIALEHGSLLMMQGATQRYWKHHIPKRAHAEGRINLTFRTLKISK